MLCYWIVRHPDGSPAGLVRVQNDRVRLSLSAPVEGRFTLFSETDAVPIVPESETVLPRPLALLGTDGDRVTCFAAAEHAAPLAAYRKRLSHNRTINVTEAADSVPASDHAPYSSHTDPAPAVSAREQTPVSDDMHHISTMQVDSVSDSAREAQVFSLLLQRAEAFYAAYEGDSMDDMVHKEDTSTESVGIDLFSQEFPGARWRYVDGTDVLPHYEGTWKQPNGPTLHILAVRGHAAPRPPRSLLGFTRFLRDRDGTGYWLRLTPLP